jgi:hypothetical protein
MQPESRSSKLNSCTMGTKSGVKRIEPDVSASTVGRGTAAETQLMVTEKMLVLVEAAEKAKIIRLVEQSPLPARRCPADLRVRTE